MRIAKRKKGSDEVRVWEKDKEVMAGLRVSEETGRKT